MIKLTTILLGLIAIIGCKSTMEPLEEPKGNIMLYGEVYLFNDGHMTIDERVLSDCKMQLYIDNELFITDSTENGTFEFNIGREYYNKEAFIIYGDIKAILEVSKFAPNGFMTCTNPPDTVRFKLNKTKLNIDLSYKECEHDDAIHYWYIGHTGEWGEPQ